MRKLKYIAIALTAALATVSCSDDHFNIDPNVEGQKTLWENISNTPELSQFAYILENTYHSKSEGTRTEVKYSELLDHDQRFTIWAPVNDSFDFEYYKNLLAKGDQASNYLVEKELIQNNMVRFNNVVNGNKDKDITLFNNKTTVLDCSNFTIGGKSITTPNLSCSNGVLHITEAPIDYNLNLYEFISAHEGLDSLRDFLRSYEKYYFDEYSSTQGPTINGNITWVDSVQHLSNEYFSLMRADINIEDSLYAMVLPTNEAWEEALARTKNYFKYMPTYTQTITTINDKGESSDKKTTKTYTEEELDSIVNLYSKNAICQDLVFNAKHQFKTFNIDEPYDCDSLYTTAGTIIRTPNVEPIFKDAQRFTMSNGYGYVTNKFSYTPQDTWAYKKEIEAEYNSYVESNRYCKVEPFVVRYLLQDSIIEMTMMKTPLAASSSNPEITYKLQGVLSCKYDIFVVMGYNFEADQQIKFKASLSYHDGKKATQTTYNFKPETGDIHDGAEKSAFINRICPFTNDNDDLCLTDTICLAHDFEFPVCYKGTDFYPTLKLSAITPKDKTKFTREFWIDKILLIAKDE